MIEIEEKDWEYIIDCLEVDNLDYPYNEKCKEIIEKYKKEKNK